MLTPKADFDRFVETHEPHYFMAQASGFTLIREIEGYLKEANSYAGSYTGYIDHMTEDLIITASATRNMRRP